MRILRDYSLPGAVALAVILAPAISTAGDEEELVRIHRAIIEAHKAGDVEAWISHEPEELIMVRRGEVSYRKKSSRAKNIADYLGRSEFYEYRDLIDPVVSVSDDGTMGWLIAQVNIVGTLTNDDGERISFDSVWAWVELYEKKDDRWYRVGEVSNVRPVNK